MDWSIQLALKDCIAAGGVAATVAGIVAAVRVSRLKSRTHCDQQYFIEYSKRYQELVSRKRRAIFAIQISNWLAARITTSSCG